MINDNDSQASLTSARMAGVMTIIINNNNDY